MGLWSITVYICTHNLAPECDGYRGKVLHTVVIVFCSKLLEWIQHWLFCTLKLPVKLWKETMGLTFCFQFRWKFHCHSKLAIFYTTDARLYFQLIWGLFDEWIWLPLFYLVNHLFFPRSKWVYIFQIKLWYCSWEHWSFWWIYKWLLIYN